MAKVRHQKVKTSQNDLLPILAVGVLVSLTFWIPHIDSFNVSKFVLLGIGAFSLSVIALVQMKEIRHRSLGSFALTGFIALLVINLITSPNFYKTLVGVQGRNNGVLTYFFLAVVAFSVSQRFNENQTPKLLWALSGLGVIQTIYNLIQLAELDPINWNNPYGLILGTLGNSDFAAALLAICSVATMWLVVMPQTNKFISVGLVALIFVELIVMYKSSVRQSLVLFIFGLSVVVYSELHKRHRTISFLWVGFVTLGGFFAVLGSLKIGPLTRYVFKESISYRGDYWRAAWRMFTDNPLFGVGLGNYGDYFNRYRDSLQVSRRGPELSSDVAHSLPLDFLAMGGSVLGSAYILLIALSVILVLRKINRSSNDEKTTGFVIFSLLGSYLLQSLISIDQIGLAVWGWIFIGAALSFSSSKINGRKIEIRIHQLFSSFAVVISLISFIFVLIPTWQASSTLKKLASLPFEQQGINAGAMRLELASKLVSTTPHDSQNKTQAALYLLTNNQSEGIDYAKKAIQQNPSDSTALNYLVIAFTQLNDAENIVKYKAQAIKIDPFNPNLK